MSTKEQFEKRLDGTGLDAGEEHAALMAAGDGVEQDTVLEQALRNFKLSVRAWSEAAYSRPRVAQMAVRHRSWRLAAGWAMACVLVAGSVSGGVIEHVHQRQAAARAAAARVQELQRERQEQMAAARQRQVQDQKLMTTVDTDISQEVPSAMEPLADLMENSGTQ